MSPHAPPAAAEPPQYPAHIPFVESLGITLVAMAGGHSELQLQAAEVHQNAWRVVHGGVVMTMLDVAMAMAARSRHPTGVGVATIEMKTSFMRPAEGLLRALGHVDHATATMAFCSADVVDDAGHVCAKATGTFKFLRGLPVRQGIQTGGSVAPHPSASDKDTP